MAGNSQDLDRIAALLRESEDAPATAAAMMAFAVDVLSRAGGPEVAAGVLLGQLRRVHEGRAPKPLHPPGNA